MEKHILISIGRQVGSGGREIALELGRKLGIPVYDREILSKAAQESGFDPKLFEKNDEQHGIFSFSNIFSGGNGGYCVGQNFVNGDELTRLQAMALRSIAKKGPGIFVGRASDYILQDMECLDVFISSPEEKRVERIAAKMGLNAEDALKHIKKTEKQRAKFYNDLCFGDKWGVASNYDICLDSSVLGIEGTADTIIDFGRRMGLID